MRDHRGILYTCSIGCQAVLVPERQETLLDREYLTGKIPTSWVRLGFLARSVRANPNIPLPDTNHQATAGNGRPSGLPDYRMPEAR